MTFRNNRRRLSPAQRSICRKAIVSAAGWPSYASREGINAAVLSGETLFRAADAVGVDLQHALTDAAQAARDAQTATFGRIGQGADKTLVAPDKPSGRTGDVDWQRVRQIAREEARFAVTPVVKEVVVAVNAATGTRKTLGDAPTHPAFAKLAKAATVRDFSGQRLNIFLVGPTGTGKSYACRQLAKLLDLPFYFQSQASESFDLVGYERVNGVQKITPFVEAFRSGGICLLDECDRYDAKASTALNSALANGEITLDNGEVIKRHPDFICVASGNTFGFGGSADFTAAEKMDLSTISRFPVRLDWHIHAETENLIAKAFAADAAIAAAWLAECRAVREAMDRQGLPYLADQRCVEAGANLLAAGMAPSDVRAITYLASLDSDQASAVLSIAHNKLMKG